MKRAALVVLLLTFVALGLAAEIAPTVRAEPLRVEDDFVIVPKAVFAEHLVEVAKERKEMLEYINKLEGLLKQQNDFIIGSGKTCI